MAFHFTRSTSKGKRGARERHQSPQKREAGRFAALAGLGVLVAIGIIAVLLIN